MIPFVLFAFITPSDHLRFQSTRGMACRVCATPGLLCRKITHTAHGIRLSGFELVPSASDADSAPLRGPRDSGSDPATYKGLQHGAVDDTSATPLLNSAADDSSAPAKVVTGHVAPTVSQKVGPQSSALPSGPKACASLVNPANGLMA